MRFLVDAQLPPGLCRWFEARGHEVEHVFDLGMHAAPDEEVAARAAETGAVLVTKDEDFLARSGSGGFQLLWLRCGNVSNRGLAEWLDVRWMGLERLLKRGEALVEVV
jgi:predicted nuclease of predicted toxin-antitoxin system